MTFIWTFLALAIFVIILNYVKSDTSWSVDNYLTIGGWLIVSMIQSLCDGRRQSRKERQEKFAKRYLSYIEEDIINVKKKNITNLTLIIEKSANVNKDVGKVLESNFKELDETLTAVETGLYDLDSHLRSKYPRLQRKAIENMTEILKRNNKIPPSSIVNIVYPISVIKEDCETNIGILRNMSKAIKDKKACMKTFTTLKDNMFFMLEMLEDTLSVVEREYP